MWFHIECLGEPQRTRRMCGPLIQQLLKAPVARGAISSASAEWTTVGSGRLVTKVLAQSRIEGPHDWKEILGSSFLSYVTDPPPSFFECPTCYNLI